MKPARIQAVIYRRVSSKRQNDEGRSLKDQDKGLVALCKVMGWRIIGNFEDACSGRGEKTEKRVGFAAAVELACREKATLVVYDLDRLARCPVVGMKVIDQIRKAGAQLYIKSLGVDTNTPAGEMIAGIMLAVAKWGSRNIGVGVRRANEETVRERGFRTQGPKRFGYRYDAELGRIVEVPEEQAVIATVLELAATADAENLSFGDMAQILNERGVPSPRKGVKWARRGVALIVHRHGAKEVLA